MAIPPDILEILKKDPDRRNSDDVRKLFWYNANKDGIVTNSEEEEVFRLTQEEADKCRFTKPDNNYRMCYCTIHEKKIAHGVRLFPPHLWDWKDGEIFHRESMNSEWKKWTANIKMNATRLTN